MAFSKKATIFKIMENKRQECLVYSRVVGWLTPVQNWNKGKVAEFKDRKVYEIKQDK